MRDQRKAISISGIQGKLCPRSIEAIKWDKFPCKRILKVKMVASLSALAKVTCPFLKSKVTLSSGGFHPGSVWFLGL